MSVTTENAAALAPAAPRTLAPLPKHDFGMNLPPFPPHPLLGLMCLAEPKKALRFAGVATIAFDPKLFGTASNNGQMISDIARRAAAPFLSISNALLDGAAPRRVRRRGLFSKLSRRGAA